MSHPTIGDSNNICHVVARKSSSKSDAVAAIYNNWVHYGLVVVPVVDGDICPTCKQAYNEPIARKDSSNRIESFWLMAEANKKKREITNGYGSLPFDDLRAIDRLIRMNLEELNKQIVNRPKPMVTTDLKLKNNPNKHRPMKSPANDTNEKIDAVTADADESSKVILQMVELMSPNTNLKINQSIAHEAGLPYDLQIASPVATPKEIFFNSEARISRIEKQQEPKCVFAS